ncbi:MAG: cytochrome c biogenesis protein ResB [Armatimonadetes bacterium]|nr:cytochrome c biogenesis protein ResB [Armatimonadota bacterium]
MACSASGICARSCGHFQGRGDECEQHPLEPCRSAFRKRIKDIPKYSGFQVKKDPGVPIVYLGFFILTVGAFLSLYVSHRLLRIGVQELSGKLEITFVPVRIDREQTYDTEIEKLKAALAASS